MATASPPPLPASREQLTAEQVEAREEWIDALTEGGYKQGRGQLQHDGRFCCLGVACDVADPTQWVGETWGGQRTHLPLERTKALAVLDTGGLRVLGEYPLTNLNDDGVDFGSIAWLIYADTYGLEVQESVPEANGEADQTEPEAKS